MAKDNNQVETLLGTSNADGITPIAVKVDPTTHALEVSDNNDGSDLSDDIARRNSNMQPVLLATSSVDGLTPVAIYVNASGQLLINSS
jgi:hypothetical protein